MCNVICSLAILDVNLDHNSEMLSSSMVKQILPHCSMEEKHQLFLANQHFSPDWQILTHDAKEAVLKAARAKEENRTKWKEPFLRNCETLIQVECSVFIEEIGSYVDLFSSEQRRVIQFDGLTHFLSGDTHDGSSLLQTRLLKKYKCNVDRVQITEFHSKLQKAAILNQ